MYYHFDSNLAVKYGVDEAIVLNNLIFWINKNIVNEKHNYDGNYWTYNSAKAFTKLLPFWNEKKIRRVLDSLIEQGVVIAGNYNKSPYDRTLWYAIVDKNLLIDTKEGETQAISHLPFLVNQEDKTGNGFIESGSPIPYINTDNKNTNIKTNDQFLKIDKKPIENEKILNEQNNDNVTTAIKEQMNPPKTPLISETNTSDIVDKNRNKKPKETQKMVIESYTSNEVLRNALFRFVENFRESRKYNMPLNTLKSNLDKISKLDDVTQINVVKSVINSGYSQIYDRNIEMAKYGTFSKKEDEYKVKIIIEEYDENSISEFERSVFGMFGMTKEEILSYKNKKAVADFTDRERTVYEEINKNSAVF